ncbi:MAG TPA: cation transporter, partial [Polyangium sp.]|nr:cation transporter [Polyangium sp.]
MQTYESSSSGLKSSSARRTDAPRRQDPKRHVVFRVDGLSCRHMAGQMREMLRQLPGILSASVSFSERTAYVCHDPRFTHEREIIATMAQRGFWLSPALGLSFGNPSWFDAPRIGLVIALIGNLMGLAVWPRARVAPQLPWVEAGLALCLLMLASPSIAVRAYNHAKRGIWSADLVALIASFGSVGIGVAIFVAGGTAIPLTPNFLLRFGPRPDGASALAFEAAGSIVGFVFLANHVHAALIGRQFVDLERAIRQQYAQVRHVHADGGETLVPRALVAAGDRLRLVMGDVVPLDLKLDVAARVTTKSGRVEERSAGQTMFRGERLVSIGAVGRIDDVGVVDARAESELEVARETRRIQEAAWRREDARVETLVAKTLTIVMVWFAVFALVVHVASTRAPLHPGAALAGVAVLAGASPAAFMFGVPIARIKVVLEARTRGVVIKDVAAIEALATVSRAFFDLSGHVFLDAPKALRALWHRDIGCCLLGKEDADVTTASGHRLGVATTERSTLERSRESLEVTRARGEHILVVGPNDTAQMIPVDVEVVVGPNERPSTIVAPILLRVPNLLALVWLVDTARRLRSRSRL